MCIYLRLHRYYVKALRCLCLHIRGEPIRVAGVVVVDIATRIDIPRIVRIATIRRAQPNVLSNNLHPILFRISFMPSDYECPGIERHLRPIPYFFPFQMKEPPRNVYQREKFIAFHDGSSLILFPFRPSAVARLHIDIVSTPCVDIYVLRASDDVVCERVLILFNEYVFVLAYLYCMDSEIHRLLTCLELSIRCCVRDIPLPDVYCHIMPFYPRIQWVRGLTIQRF